LKTDLPSNPLLNPCIRCGVCCATYRVSFYWAECDDATPDGVPAGMTERLTHFRSCMTGTNAPKPRCIALTGELGVNARCSIYPHRPSVCRAVTPSYYDGRPHAQCDQARQAHGLPLLSPADWPPTGAPDDPDDAPRTPGPPRRLDPAA
jgi:hypothetical protein